MASPPPRKLPIPLRLLAFGSVPVLLIGFGTVGYHLIEGWSWFYSFYAAVITLSSIGYGERNPLSTEGRVFTIVLALGGIFTVAIAVTEVLSTVVTGELRDFVGRWRMRRRIEALEQHVIVCGYGDVGQHVCAELQAGGAAVVVIDRLEAAFTAARDAGTQAVLGDAAADVTLSRAGIERARALIVAAGTDADNVLITMSARLLRPEIPIVARAQETGTVSKLHRAGATRTVSPDAISGGLMAQAVLRPDLQLQVQMEMDEELVPEGSPLDGTTVGTSGLRSREGLILVAIKHQDGNLAFNPTDDAPVAAGDTLITLGSREKRGRADAFAHSR